MFKNLALKVKLLGGFGVVLLLLSGIMGLYQYTIDSATGEFENLIAQELEIRNRAGEVESQMLACRALEKDFLAHPARETRQAFEVGMARLIETSAAIAAMAERSDNAEAEEIASAITRNANAYLDHFRRLAMAVEIVPLWRSSVSM